jgi:hypothetical protein
MNRFQNKTIVIIGPSTEGLGGISRVARIWRDSGVFSELNASYVATTTDETTNSFTFLLKALFHFFEGLTKGAKCVYIHTSSNRSFYRKSIFIILSYILKKNGRVL